MTEHWRKKWGTSVAVGLALSNTQFKTDTDKHTQVLENKMLELYKDRSLHTGDPAGKLTTHDIAAVRSSC